MGVDAAGHAGKPVIAIINTWSELNPCHMHLRERAEQVKRGVWQAGGFPVEFGAATLSETYYNYATFLASQGRTAEAREWAQKILAKKPTMPGYLRRRERPWFRKANGLLSRLTA